MVCVWEIDRERDGVSILISDPIPQKREKILRFFLFPLVENIRTFAEVVACAASEVSIYIYKAFDHGLF